MRNSPRGRGSRGGHAYQKLRDALKSGALKPGDRIMEVPIAKQLNVSRTPGARRDPAPRIGRACSSTSRVRVSSSRDSTGARSPSSTRCAKCSRARRRGSFTRHASDIEVDHLLELVDQERHMQGKGEELAAHNHRFHVHIHRGAHNRYLESGLSLR